MYETPATVNKMAPFVLLSEASSPSAAKYHQNAPETFLAVQPSYHRLFTVHAVASVYTSFRFFYFKRQLLVPYIINKTYDNFYPNPHPVFTVKCCVNTMIISLQRGSRNDLQWRYLSVFHCDENNVRVYFVYILIAERQYIFRSHH